MLITERYTSKRKGSGDKLAKKMEELGAFKNHKPFALGIWIRMSDEYQFHNQDETSRQIGLFCALLNVRILLSAINGICELKGLSVANDLDRITLTLNEKAKNGALKSWKKWGSQNGKEFYERMADLEADLCEMIDDPFWDGDSENYSHNSLWSIEALSSLNIFIDGKSIPFRPLIMLDDAHELSEIQRNFLYKLLVSRQAPIPFWISLRKQACGMEYFLTESMGKGIEKGRDYEIIDIEKNNADFRKRVLDVATLRIQFVSSQIGSISEAFENFMSDDNEEIYKKTFNEEVVQKIKDKIHNIAGSELTRFQGIINEIEEQYKDPLELCLYLRMLENFVQRELGKIQRSFSFQEISVEAIRKHIKNKNVVEAVKLFLAEEYNLPYYFGAPRLITLSSFNINQFLKLSGELFEEIRMAIRINRVEDSFISQVRQHKIIVKIARNFLKELPIMVPQGKTVFQLVKAIGNMANYETYRPNAPYAPGVTGTALTMDDFGILKKQAQKGEETSLTLYQTIESAIAHNILEPKPYYMCKGKEFLVLNLNRLLCVPFKLPLQRGGFREQKLTTLFRWMKFGYKKRGPNEEQGDLWI